MRFRERLEAAVKRGEAVPELRPSDIDALTENQRRVLGEVSVGNDGGHAEKTLFSLVAKGWLVSVQEKRSFGLTVYRYTMPIHAHVVWCEWCAKNVKEPV